MAKVDEKVKIKEEKHYTTIDVCFASDDNYVVHMATAIASILKNSSYDDYFKFYVLDGGISDKNKQKLLSLKKIRPFDIIFCDMTMFDFSELPLNRSYISIATYYRLFILDIIPDNVKKLIYLDCDIIVKDDLLDLYNIDIDDYLAGVVEDEGSISQIKRLNLPLENNYFNAGIIVFNLDKLRSFGYKKKCFEYYKNNKEIITLQDQDILNGVFNGKCKFLPLRWNANGRLYCYNDLERNYTLEDEAIAKKNPGILHYTDVAKPWKVRCSHPLQHEYYMYKFYTPYWFIGFKAVLYRIFIQNVFSMKNIYINKQKYKYISILGISFKVKVRNKRD